MNPFFRLRCEFDVLTPMFLGGASQDAELRAPSIKGVLRFWFRALDPNYDNHEPLLFGSGGTKAGQSLLLLQCTPGQRANDRLRWADTDAKKFDVGSGRQTKNGLTYLGYPFGMKGNDERTAFVPRARFNVDVRCHRPTPDGLNHGVTPLRAALASVWALGHFGSLGTRARRGFGAISLVDWSLVDRDDKPISDPDFAALSLLHSSKSSAEWTSGADRALATFRSWFGPHDVEKKLPHPHFGPKATFVLGKQSIRRDDWRRALDSLGRSLQDFRQRNQPDYDHVKGHVLYEMRQSGQRIERVPDRATFGLPLTFRFGSVPQGRPVNFAPVNGERHASLLFLRPVLTADSLVSLFLRLDGAVPGMDTRVGLRGAPRALEPAAHNAMDKFINDMKGKG